MPQPVKLFCVKCLCDTQHMPGGDPLVMNCYCGQPFVKQDEKNIHRNLGAIIMVAKHEAKEHNCNYNIILMNPVDGELGPSSTYEMVTDSYFEKERPNVKLIATTLQLGVIIYDQWLPYTEYEKAECDIKLHDDTIIYHCYPNAGKFNPMCADSIKEVPEEQVKEIMYRKYYLEDLCKKNDRNCNNVPQMMRGLKGLKYIEPGVLQADEIDRFIEQMSDTSHFSNFPNDLPNRKPFGKPVPIRTEPKIQRNALCDCQSGKKYKHCCLKN